MFVATFYLSPPLHINSSHVVAMEEMDVTVRESSLFYVIYYFQLNPWIR